jgi:hypothetical protein
MQDFTGIGEKLKRSQENIFDLHEEIVLFFKESDHPIIPNNDSKLLLEAIEYHKKRLVPPRFGVLAGEIIHHLRSCFDHVVWHFSDISVVKNVRKIEFPVFEVEPSNHDSRKSFEGKIEGINNPDVLALIKEFQPYKSADPLDHPLWIIHDFDIIDKHREIVLGFPSGTALFPVEMKPILEAYQRAHPELNSIQVARHFKSYGTLMPQVSFRDFGRRKVEPLIPALVSLYNYTVDVIKAFEVL